MDITKCSGENCPMKESCYRFRAEADEMQSYFIEPPIKDGKCEHYWETKGIKKYLEKIN